MITPSVPARTTTPAGGETEGGFVASDPADDLRLFQAALRNDLSTFAQKAFQTISPGSPYLHNWHVDAIAHHLEGVLAGTTQRLLITMPPRHLKSTLASVALPAFALGRDPKSRLVCVSYSQDLADKHARDCRAVMESSWYQECFPRTRLDPRRSATAELATTRRGFRLATSVGGTLTGRGGGIVVIDDPIRTEDANSETKRRTNLDWYRNTLLSRLDDPRTGAIVVVMQRTHEEDLAGALEEAGDWTTLSLPAIAEESETVSTGPNTARKRGVGDVLHPERHSLVHLDALKREMGSYDFAAQYQQNPAPTGGGVLKWEWFATYDEPPGHEAKDHVVLSVDAASKPGLGNDYTVVTLWRMRDRLRYLLDLKRVQVTFTGLRDLVTNLAAEHEPHFVLIEDAAAGVQLIQDLKAETSIPVRAVKADQDKLSRALSQTPVLEAGRVLIPESAPWLDAFRQEWERFPRARHDDQVDSVIQALRYFQERARRPKACFEVW